MIEFLLSAATALLWAIVCVIGLITAVALIITAIVFHAKHEKQKFETARSVQ